MSADTRLRNLVIDQLGVEDDEITNDASFTDDLGADELDVVELIMMVEVEFNLEIDDDIADTLDTFGKLLTYIEETAK